MTYAAPPNAPPWFAAAVAEIGFHETGDNHGIGRYIALAKCGAEGVPWCAIFANAMLEVSNVKGTRSPWSQSFAHNSAFQKIDNPMLGCIAVFWRGSLLSHLGHVGFVAGISADSQLLYVLGGNEGNSVEIETLPIKSNTFGLVGYYMPAGWTTTDAAPVMTGGTISTKVT